MPTTPRDIDEAASPRRAAPWRLAMAAGRERRFRYALHNDSSAAAEVYVAVPTEGPDQTVRSLDVDVVPATGDTLPLERLTLPDGAAVVVTLPPEAELTVKARVRPWTRCLTDDDDTDADTDADADADADDTESVALTAQQRQHYLRATPLTPITPELRAEASAIAGPSTDTIDRARSLFDHLTGGLYRCTDSEDSWGAEAFRAGRKGAAADFAWLFVAWCRSLSIPARAVFGAWPNLLEEQHAWAEFHVAGLGWVPVDPAVGATLRRRDDTFESYGVGEDADAHFGGLIGERVVFLRDGPVELPERFSRVSDDLDEPAVPQPDLIVMHEPDAAVLEGDWEIWYSGWRAPLNAAYFTCLVALLCLFLFQAAARFLKMGIPGFVLPALVGLGIFTVGAAVVLRRRLSIELSITAVILGGLAIGFAESFRDAPVIGPVVTFLFP